MLLIMGLSAMAVTSCKNKPQADMNNPFFSDYSTPFNVPPFDKIKAKHYMPAFERGMAEGRQDIQNLINNRMEPDFDNTIGALDKAGELLTKVRKVFFEQASANTNDSLKNLEVEISPKLTEYEDEIRLNPALFSRIKSVYMNQSKFSLNDEQKYILENLYKSFIRNGANLSPQDQDTLKKFNQRLALLTVKFEQNVLEETNRYKLYVDRKDLTGLPEYLIGPAAAVAKASGQEGKYAFTTQRPSVFPFITYSPDRKLRKDIFTAYTMRGNNGNEFDNNRILAEIVKLRAARAKLLGYKTHADIVLESRMAKTPANVFTLLNNLWGKAIPVSKIEVAQMQKIIDREGGKFKLEPSDWWYYAEKLRKQEYDLNDNELKPYFKFENVRDGAFECATRLYGITFTALNNIPLPQADAQAFEVKNSDGSHVGILYMDFFTRESKQQGAWCGTYRDHLVIKDATITPVVTTVFNFARSTGDTPSLLTLDDVSTIFHEFGHALESLFSKNTYNLTYVAQDFVELPSQLMEHWATEAEVLNLYAKHYKTGEPIPASLIKKINNSKYFNQGFANVEVYAASLLDMAYHTLEAPAIIDIQSFEKEYFAKLGLIPEIVSRYRSTYFTHIMGGYDAGYYSYTWSSVLDNDAFEAFKENGIFDRATAESFRKNILEKDGTVDPMEMFVRFRGREPQIEPLLRNKGLL
jgi:peptidyl-dipeptidase Dcp